MSGIQFFAWVRRRFSRAASVPADIATTSVLAHGVSPRETAELPIERAEQVVAYDENLLEKVRTQWYFGDWETLIKLERSVLQHHPDRAKLAILAAAGHQQTGNAAQARQFAQLARDWGCSKKLLAQVLISGVHNSLGRAAAIGGQTQRAAGHFESAIAIGAPGNDGSLLAQARSQHQLAQLDLPQDWLLQVNSVEPLPLSQYAPSLARQLEERLHSQHQDLALQLQKQQGDLVSARRALEATFKKELSNATKQLEAFLGLQSYLNTGELTPDMHGWPVSPDFALYLIELLEKNDYDLIIEFGSGTSTVLMARALARQASRRTRRPTVQVAFEHLEQFHRQTESNMKLAGCADAARVLLAPLTTYAAPNGLSYSYYSCDATLASLAAELDRSGLRVLLVVDGPPAATGKHARYPAVPLVLQHFRSAQLDILLDDFMRDDEKEVAQLWLADLRTAGRSVDVTEKKMEKDACLLSALPSSDDRAAP